MRLTDDEWRLVMSVHLDGTFYCSRAAARSMGPRGSGVIVNMASVCGIEGCTGHPHYSAAKAAILGFTRATAKELIVQGIRVNAIAPGFIDTAPARSTRAVIPRSRARPAGRLGTPGRGRRDGRVPGLRRCRVLRRRDAEPQRRPGHRVSTVQALTPGAP